MEKLRVERKRYRVQEAGNGKFPVDGVLCGVCGKRISYQELVRGAVGACHCQIGGIAGCWDNMPQMELEGSFIEVWRYVA